MRKLLAVLAFTAGTAAWGQAFEGWLSLGESLVSNAGLGSLQTTNPSKNDIVLQDGFRFSLRMGLNTKKFSGFEVGYAYNRTGLHFNDGSTADIRFGEHQGTVNYLLYALPEGSKFRPFGTVGVGFNNYSFQGSSNTKLGVNVGAGVKVKLTSLYAIRFDVREYFNGKPFDLPLKSGWIRQTEVSGGFGVTF
jgi:opacity protein-like surface antigen